MIRGLLGVPDLESPSDGYALVWSASVGRGLWKPISEAALTGFTANQIPVGTTTGGLAGSTALTWDGSRLLVGNGSPSADLTGILVNRSITSTPNDHGFREESVVNVASGAGGFCSFDSLPTFNGAATYDHEHGFQARPLYNGSGSVIDLVGYWAQVGHTGAGTATNAKGLWLKDASGSGAITNAYGLYVESIARGGTLNYAIFTNAGLVRFGGQVVLASATAGTPTLTATAAVAGDHGVSVRNTDGGTGSYAYLSFRNDATASCIFQSFSSGYTGTTFGITAANYVGLNAFGASNNGLLIGCSVAKPIVFGTNDTERMRIDGAGVVTIASTTASSSTATGALIVSGGVGIAKQCYVGSSSIASPLTVVGSSNVFTAQVSDALTNTAATSFTLDHLTSGTAAAGFGHNIFLLAQDSTTASQRIAVWSSVWADAAHATRKGRNIFYASDAANERECIRIETSGTAAMVGFLGANAAVRQTSGADLTNNVTSGGTSDQIDNFTSLTVYATDAAAIRNAIYQLAKKLKQVNDALRLYGLLT